MNRIDLSERCAIVTGGGSGIGFAAAKRFLQSGATVQLWGRTPEKLDRAVAELAPLGKVDALAVDVGSAESAKNAADAFLARHGKIDILFNCAGIAQPTQALVAMSIQDWRDNIAINLDGVFYCCRAVLPAMMAASYGRIINTASMAGKDGNAFQPAYSAAKAGVIALTKSLGKELATSGVTVNCIVPTLFETPMADSVVSAAPEVMAGILDKIPMKRFGRPEEAAAMVAWLASDECSFTTGFAFDLSGGRATY
jgi:2-dehydro-3-deoxy-L-rhamnonate dehydrogenase (NAD+)